MDYSPREVAAAAAVTPEVLDYWTRTRLVTLDDGHGYSARSMSLALVLSEAARLGASGRELAAIVEALPGPPAEWPDSLWLDSHGSVHGEDEAPAAIVLHVRRVLAAAGPAMFAALNDAA